MAEDKFFEENGFQGDQIVDKEVEEEVRKENKDKGLSVGAIVGIVIGALLLLVIIILGAKYHKYHIYTKDDKSQPIGHGDSPGSDGLIYGHDGWGDQTMG